MRRRNVVITQLDRTAIVNNIVGSTSSLGLTLSAVLVLTLGASAAQAAETAQAKTAPPSGIGGCIYRILPRSVSVDALTAVISHGNIASVLREPVAVAAPKCTGRPYSASDSAVVGSVFSVYSRMAAAYALDRQVQLPERQLIAAWVAATPAERAPYLASAQTFIRPESNFQSVKPDAVTPFEQRLGLNEKGVDPNTAQLLQMYYSALALSQLAEADLASRGASPPPGG